jgi:thioredoxin-related protein
MKRIITLLTLSFILNGLGQNNSETNRLLTTIDTAYFSNSGTINFEEELKKANNQKKSLLIFFSSHSCVNSRKMEQLIVTNSLLLETLQNKYHFVTLYLDDPTSLSKSEVYTSPFSKKKITTIGKKNIDLQQEKCKTDYQPFFAVFDSEGVMIKSQGYTNDGNEVAQFLN